MTDQPRMTRRAVIGGALVGGAAVAVGGKYLVDAFSDASTSGCVWAVQVNDNLSIGGGSPTYWTYVPALETKLGRKFAGWRRNGITGTDDYTAYKKAYDRGWHWSYANGKWDTGSATNLWRDTAAGRWDSFYSAYFQKIKADTRWTAANPFHFSFHHEQYVKSELGGIGAGTAAQYIAAFRHVRGLMDAASAHVSKGGNMLMTWVPHWRQFYGDPVYGSWKPTSAVAPFVVTKLYPGDDVVDKVGVDLYHGGRVSTSITAAKQWTPVHAFSLAHGKPFFTGETGIDGTDSFVVSYLKQLDALLKSWGGGSAAGQCEALCWTTRVAADGDYRPDKTSTRLAQYKAMAQDAFYSKTL
jgi:hypothetical protein